jgi:hypothetical protein
MYINGKLSINAQSAVSHTSLRNSGTKEFVFFTMIVGKGTKIKEGLIYFVSWLKMIKLEEVFTFYNEVKSSINFSGSRRQVINRLRTLSTPFFFLSFCL